MTEHATNESQALTSLDEYERQVAELKEKYSKVPDVHTKAGYKEAKEALRELTSMRTGTEKGRLAITEPLRNRVKEINDLAKSLVSEVGKIEKPIRDAKQYVDDEIKRKNEARQAKIREGITRDITSFLDTAKGSTDAAEIQAMVKDLKILDVSIYGELEKEADSERHRVIGELSTIALDMMTQEKAPEPYPAPSPLNDIADSYGSYDPASSGFDAPVARNPGTTYDDALEDLRQLLNDDDAETLLISIMAGEIRHITFDS